MICSLEQAAEFVEPKDGHRKKTGVQSPSLIPIADHGEKRARNLGDFDGF
jgi:hypothetical protein